MGSEVLSLKWNGHKNTFFDVLATAREKKTFCDATIACEGNLYPVHRFVISTCSTFFERILENISDMHPVIVLADIKSKDIEDLLQYMYTGEVKVLQENIDGLIKAGKLLKIKGIEVAGETENPKKQKRLFRDSEERPVKYQRTDEFDGSSNSRENKSYRESKNQIEEKHSSEGCNEDTNQKGIDGSLGPLNHPIPEFIPVKEEIFLPSEDLLHFPEHNIKEELSKSLVDEEDIPSADSEKVIMGRDLIGTGDTATDNKPTVLQQGKSFLCSYCPHIASQKTDLQRHIRTHTGEKPYACKFCDFQAAQPSTLTQHERIHTGEKPFVCHLCQFRTSRSSTLKQHMYTHKKI